MSSSLTDALCTRCALCCDGSLFADVELASRAEATGLEILGLETEDDDTSGGLLLLPCGALRGTRCGIYAHRPECCRTFECRLLQDVRRGVVSEARALEHIANVRERIGRIRELVGRSGRRAAHLPLAERGAEALARRAGASPEAQRKRLALEAAITDVETMIRKTFLHPGSPRASEA
jgi:hypothetical protein